MNMKHNLIIVIHVFLLTTLWGCGSGNEEPVYTSDNPEIIIDESSGGSSSEYSIDQSISQMAQEMTIAYDGLAFITGNQCSDSFLPPGKVADFFGFQYLRDNTADGMGHNTDFVTNAANNVLYILNDSQKSEILALAATQDTLINQFAYERLPLMKAFRSGLDDNKALDQDAVVMYAKQLQLDDAIISIQRAKLFGSIIRSLSTDQKAYLDDMVSTGFEMWPSLEEQIDRTTMSHEQHVLVMTYASELFGWYAGSVEADTYFAPERQANYFGSFYMKDAPAMGNDNYTIDETITGNKGAEFLTYLSDTQQSLVTEIVDLQYDNLLSIVDVRRQISTELRKFLTQDSIDEELVMTLSETYGALDGANSYLYATRFAELNSGLSELQISNLMTLRDLEDYPCEDSNIYIYSDIQQLSTIQSIIDITGIAAYLLVDNGD
ncbi:MAG: hypothetical protein GY808_00185 [Gammaproteobacteria bacterium]|nr:hypothetical protein [Gammaproteobacteria bacterium]